MTDYPDVMPERGWTIHLADGSRILVELHTNRSRTEAFAVVLVSEIDGAQVCITRYDTAHDQPHRDVLGRRGGLIEKEWLLLSKKNEAFDYALKDVRTNHERYIEYYLAH